MPLKYRILAIVVPDAVIFDQFTKWLVLKHFHLGETVAVIPYFFNLTYVRNTGAAFSFLHDAPAWFREPFFLLVPVAVLIGLFFYFKKLPNDKISTALALSLIAGGAFGNMIDRIRLGYVVDFLHAHWKYQYHWPMFNIADSCIVVGVTILIVESWFPKKTALP